jgi:hypothetical protein
MEKDFNKVTIRTSCIKGKWEVKIVYEGYVLYQLINNEQKNRLIDWLESILEKEG